MKIPARLLPFTLLVAAVPVTAQQPPAAPVETAPVTVRQMAPAVTVTGQVQSRAAADVAAGVAGTLAWVAEPGAAVAVNGLIARLDTDELSLQKLEQAARVRRGEINLKQLQREAQRLRDLGDAVSRVQLDQAESAAELAAADLDIMRATLRQTEERLSRAEVRAPFAGVVANRLKRAGEEVARGETVARLLDPETLEIRLFLPLRHVRAIKPGDKVQVLFDDKQASATVRAIVPAGDARSQSFEVLVDLPDVALPAGSVVRVELPLGEPQAMMAIPRDAVIIRASGLAVYRLKPGEDGTFTAERVEVTTGVADGDWVQVKGKLKDDDNIVVRGGENLQDGAPVKVVGTKTTWKSGASPAKRSSP